MENPDLNNSTPPGASEQPTKLESSNSKPLLLSEKKDHKSQQHQGVLALEEQTHLDVLNDNDQIKERIDLTTKDSIFASDFRQMVKESFTSGKHFFLAKIQTKSGGIRDDVQIEDTPVKKKPSKMLNHDQDNFSHWFNAYGIMKILFQRKGTEFVGRFHDKHPISSKNPLTNKRIIGEVEFYKVTNPELGQSSKSEIALKAQQALKNIGTNQHLSKVSTNNEQSQEQKPCVLRAEFFGTDFNFLFSSEMRQELFENCIEDNARQLMTFKEYTINSRLNEQVQLYGSNQEVMQLLADDQTSDILKQAYSRTNKFVRKGVLACFFYFLGFHTFASAVFPILVNSADSGRQNLRAKGYIADNDNSVIEDVPADKRSNIPIPEDEFKDVSKKDSIKTVKPYNPDQDEQKQKSEEKEKPKINEDKNRGLQEKDTEIDKEQSSKKQSETKPDNQDNISGDEQEGESEGKEESIKLPICKEGQAEKCISKERANKISPKKPRKVPHRHKRADSAGRQLYATGYGGIFAILFPVAGFLHDYELNRIWQKRENTFLFLLKTIIYIFYVAIIITGWIYKDNKPITRLGNLALILTPVLCMTYSFMIFKYKSGCDRRGGDRPRSNAVHQEIGAIPEDAILQRLHQAQHRQINGQRNFDADFFGDGAEIGQELASAELDGLEEVVREELLSEGPQFSQRNEGESEAPIQVQDDVEVSAFAPSSDLLTLIKNEQPNE